MRTAIDRYWDALREADEVFFDAEIGMTEEEWQALQDNAESRFLIEKEKEIDK
ncbi:MAG: hypothetical protein H8D87_06355 [Deltaproteobacteria bacterium]|nr:hypothetical protein [Candidatus Desulfobacula maris]